MDDSRRTTLIPVTPEARARAMRRMLRDDSKVHVSLDGGRPPAGDPACSPSSLRPRTVCVVPVTPEARAKAIRRSLGDETNVLVRVTDPRRRG